MSSIRPLVTITILVVVGVFLFTKINEGPARTDGGAETTADGVPALSMDDSNNDGTSLTPEPRDSETNAANKSAPQWADSASDTDDSPPLELPPARYETEAADQTVDVDDGGSNLPDLPDIPELPGADATDGLSDSAAATMGQPKIELPADIPAARYPDETDDANTDLSPSASPSTNPVSMPTMNANSADDMPTMGASATHSMPTMSPKTPSAGAVASSQPRDSMLAGEASDTFAAVWPEIQAALAEQELSHAHELLSEWYGNPALTPAENEQVESLLSQLAGTVVYSTEHRLEPAYVVQSGDTLPSIAKKFDVPWQLLAKINGIPTADGVQPGQEIKVVRGPFTAVVELGKQQLTLALNGRYAGKFPITVEPGADNREGQWVVEQKLADASADAGERVLVLRNGSPLAVSEAISITGGPTVPSGPTAVAPPAIRLSESDAEELSDILSVGSRVLIRR